MEETIVQASKKQKIIKEVPKQHYVFITKLGKLIGAQTSKNHIKKEVCDRCLHYFLSEEALLKQEEDCTTFNKCKVKLPNTEFYKSIKFKNFSNKKRMPFVIYADFESLQKKPRDNDNENICQIHQAFSVGYYLKCSYDDQLSYYRSYRGPEPAKWFVQELAEFSTFAEATFKNVKPMLPLTPEEQKAYGDATTCHICGVKGFIKNDKKRGKAQDHCRLTGKFRGPAQIECNLNYQDSRTVSVVFYNLAGYDSHLLIKNFATHCPGKVGLIPQTKEKYISFTSFLKRQHTT